MYTAGSYRLDIKHAMDTITAERIRLSCMLIPAGVDMGEINSFRPTCISVISQPSYELTGASHVVYFDCRSVSARRILGAVDDGLVAEYEFVDLLRRL